MNEQSDLHLTILGGGSAAFAGAARALTLGARVTMFNAGLPLGGTCLNVGCVPSKTLIRAAEAYHRGHHTGFKGLRLQAELLDFGYLVEQKQELIAGLRASNYDRVVAGREAFRLVEERAHLIDARTAVSATERVTGDRILIATGTSPHVPDFPGVDAVSYLTSDSVFDIDELPGSLLVLGGGYIALECAQMFSRFGCRVTLLQRSSHILSHQPAYIGGTLRGYLEAEGLNIVCKVRIDRLEPDGSGVAVHAVVDGEAASFRADRLLVATGRMPNTPGLGLVEAGVEMDEDGFVSVNEALETTAAGIYAAGDVIGDPEFVYTASYEAEMAVENALTGRITNRDYTALPWVIFTDPQVAGVGWDEEAARAHGHEVDSAVLPADRWPRLKVAHDTRGFLRLIRDRQTGKLLGARVVAPEGGDLVTELGLAIRHGLTTRDLAESFHPYLTLSEGIQRAAQRFEHDLSTA